MAYSGIRRPEYNYSNLRSDDELRSDFQTRRESDKIEQAQREAVIESQIEARRTEAEARKALEEERKARQEALKEQQRLKAISEQGRREAEQEAQSGKFTEAEAFRRHAYQIYAGNPTGLATALKEKDKIVQIPATIGDWSGIVNSNTVTGAISPIRVPTTPASPTSYRTVTEEYPESAGAEANAGSPAGTGLFGTGLFASKAVPASPAIPAQPKTRVTTRVPITNSSAIPTPVSTAPVAPAVQPTQSTLTIVTTQEDYDALPSGSTYQDTQGNVRRKK